MTSWPLLLTVNFGAKVGGIMGGAMVAGVFKSGLVTTVLIGNCSFWSPLSDPQIGIGVLLEPISSVLLVAENQIRSVVILGLAATMKMPAYKLERKNNSISKWSIA